MTIKLGNPHSTYHDVANVHKDSIRGIFELIKYPTEIRI